MMRREKAGYVCAFLMAVLFIRAPAVAGVPTPDIREALKPDRPEVPFEVIFHGIKSYGVWFRAGDDWAWRPGGVAEDWAPFREGSWIVTEYGWYWLSEQPWGWATSHYGHWEWSDEHRWLWRPGNLWAPAWVTWRQGTAAIGWRPIGMEKPGPAGSDEGEAQLRGWTFLKWKDATAGILPRPDSPTIRAGERILEAIDVTSVSLTTATPALLDATKDITNFHRGDRMALNPGPDAAAVAKGLGRRPDPVVMADTKLRREVVVFWNDRTILTTYRPIIEDSPDEIEALISRKAAEYREIQEKFGARE